MEKESFKKQNIKGKIKSITKVSSDCFKMQIVSDLGFCTSGQFISILCPNKTLRRPFSISDFDKVSKTLTIIFKLKGEGTNYLKSLKEGDSIDFLAPLGNGFDLDNLNNLDNNHKKALLIGAGIGIAPMLFLKKQLNQKGIENYLISGFKAQDEVIEGSDKTIIGGSVIDNIEAFIEQEKFDCIYSCGPAIVLKLVSQIADKFNIPSYLAMEKVMACSIGVCRGCVIKLNKNNKEEMASVCKDGPVFKGSEIIWE